MYHLVSVKTLGEHEEATSRQYFQFLKFKTSDLNQSHRLSPRESHQQLLPHLISSTDLAIQNIRIKDLLCALNWNTAINNIDQGAHSLVRKT